MVASLVGLGSVVGAVDGEAGDGSPVGAAAAGVAVGSTAEAEGPLVGADPVHDASAMVTVTASASTDAGRCMA
jgi:hypothetical protein